MALRNGDDGFLVAGDSNGNTLKANTANGNAGDGFHLEASDLNTFENNTAVRNDDWGFFVDAVLANEFKKNHCQLNGLGDANLDGIC